MTPEGRLFDCLQYGDLSHDGRDIKCKYRFWECKYTALLHSSTTDGWWWWRTQSPARPRQERETGLWSHVSDQYPGPGPSDQYPGPVGARPGGGPDQYQQLDQVVVQTVDQVVVQTVDQVVVQTLDQVVVQTRTRRWFRPGPGPGWWRQTGSRESLQLWRLLSVLRPGGLSRNFLINSSGDDVSVWKNARPGTLNNTTTQDPE